VEDVGVKLLLDQPLSRRLVPLLQGAFPGTSHVVLHGLDRADDALVWEFALREGFTIVTKDDDFQLLSFSRGHPPKVVLLRSGNGPTSQVLEILLRARPIIEQVKADNDWSLLELP
jgi:predicted nuclease of predicted toxin-antitoxin system